MPPQRDNPTCSQESRESNHVENRFLVGWIHTDLDFSMVMCDKRAELVIVQACLENCMSLKIYPNLVCL